MKNHIIVTDRRDTKTQIHYYNVTNIITAKARSIDTIDNIIGNGMKPDDIITVIFTADGNRATWDPAINIEFCND